MKIKVLNVITGGLISDGITSSWLSFCEAINKQNLHGTVQIDFAYIDGVSEVEIEHKFNDLGFNTPHLPCRMSTPFLYMRELVKLLKDGEYNIIHANGSSSLLFIEMCAGWFSGVKVRIAHSRNTDCSYKLLNKLLRVPFAILCNGRIACGKEAGKWLFGNRSFSVLHNGKDFSKFCYSEKERNVVREQLSLNGKFVIGHVGKFNEQKNHQFIIDIFKEIKAEIPNSALYLIGDGPLQGTIRKRVIDEGLGDCVYFAGAINDVNKRLLGMDVMVFPSLFEGLPNVVLEWQALGLPSFISDTITMECAPSKLVKFLGLDLPANKWAKEIIKEREAYVNRNSQSVAGINALKNAGFDINQNVQQLFQIYGDLYKSHVK